MNVHLGQLLPRPSRGDGAERCERGAVQQRAAALVAEARSVEGGGEAVADEDHLKGGVALGRGAQVVLGSSRWCGAR